MGRGTTVLVLRLEALCFLLLGGFATSLPTIACAGAIFAAAMLADMRPERAEPGVVSGERAWAEWAQGLLDTEAKRKPEEPKP